MWQMVLSLEVDLKSAEVAAGSLIMYLSSGPVHFVSSQPIQGGNTWWRNRNATLEIILGRACRDFRLFNLGRHLRNAILYARQGMSFMQLTFRPLTITQ